MNNRPNFLSEKQFKKLHEIQKEIEECVVQTQSFETKSSFLPNSLEKLLVEICYMGAKEKAIALTEEFETLSNKQEDSLNIVAHIDQQVREIVKAQRKDRPN